ncbi:MAG: rhamnulokinase [Lachnospiraceae bacterium]|nr:rhamnulokinase [Lachnospiraceae bacterium]
MKEYCLAIDIGASSGRHIVGWRENGEIKTEEVFRFPNGVRRTDGHLTWDIEAMTGFVKEGIARAKASFGSIRSLSIDTWGVDYVLMRGDEPVLPVYAYRDDRTKEAIDEVHRLIPFDELYRRTGCQFQPFTTIYQLYADKMAGRLTGVTDMLMMPQYLLFRLCGTKAMEYTDATTTGLKNAVSDSFDTEIIDTLGLPRNLFKPALQPGTKIGEYDGIDVLLCASHDTASAVEGIPMDGNCPYISSGTWSLLGVKTGRPVLTEKSAAGNWSNEGGVGYNRYQKNIMGMWVINELRRVLCPDRDFGEIVREAEESVCDITVDVNGQRFLSPDSMKAAFDEEIGNELPGEGDYFRCAYRSLAQCYAQAIRELEENTGETYGRLYIVGGGAKNAFLNRLTGEATGKEIIALPIEATALGNLKIQMQAQSVSKATE